MPAPHGEHILIVEDDPIVATLERRCLARAGYAVSVAATAEEALRELEATPADLMLLDYLLPGGTDGLEFYASLRARGYLLPVILVTGFGSETTAIQALRAGVRDFVTKSVEYLDYLPEAIHRVLRQVHLERQLADSEARFRSLVNSVDDLIVTLDRNHRITGLFGRWLARYDLAPAAFLGRTIRELAGAESAALHEQANLRALAGEKTLYEWSFTRAGVTHWFQVCLSPLQDFQGTVVGVVGVGREITEKKRAEEDLRKVQERLNGLFNSSSDGMAYVTNEGTLLDVNESFCRLTGYARDELVGKVSYQQLTPPEFHDMEAVKVADLLRTGNPQEYEKEYRRKDGTRVPIAVTAFLVKGAQGRAAGMAGIVKDITQRRLLEQQFRQAQKMEAVGQLAGGVAHDFNNLLTVINGYSELMMSQLPEAEPMRGMAEQIKKAGERAASLTGQLLAFSRKQLLVLSVLDLNAIIAEMEKMLIRLIGEDIDLRTRLDPRLWRVKADPGQLQQVVMNIVVNARDAMPQGGKLTIETKNVELDENYRASHRYARPGPHVLLAISDNGCGMDPVTQARIFEPFFTTKGPEKGTGLGLATVYGIVKQCEGHIEVYSEFGKGTTFKIYLPRCEAAPPTRKSDPGRSKPGRGAETILLVEDDEDVRALGRLILQQHGYTVLEAANGEAALELCRQHQGTIHLLVTDVVMPNLSGPQLAEQLAKLRPGLKAFYLSGYADEAVVRHGILTADMPFLQKPYQPQELAKKVRELLDTPAVANE